MNIKEIIDINQRRISKDIKEVDGKKYKMKMYNLDAIIAQLIID